jgi:ribosomal protein S18 acetylase RimI-like enzyme
MTISTAESISEDRLFRERSSFIKQHYPGDRDKKIDIINTALDGLEVLEKRDSSGNIIALRTYQLSTDALGNHYCQLGVSIVEEEERGQGLAHELFLNLKNIAEESGCQYMTAIADTDDGAVFLERQGFYLVEDSVTGREYYHFDLL